MPGCIFTARFREWLLGLLVYVTSIELGYSYGCFDVSAVLDVVGDDLLEALFYYYLLYLAENLLFVQSLVTLNLVIIEKIIIILLIIMAF